MKRLCTLLLFTIFLQLPLFSDTTNKKQLLSAKQTLEILKELSDSAIVFGNGKKVIHTFIDPYCELSQKYISFIFNKKERMFSKYTFYFYLYELKGKKSSNIITTILSSDYQETALKSIMINHEDIEYEDNDVQDSIDKIEDIAKSIGVFKRPYIIINGRVK